MNEEHQSPQLQLYSSSVKVEQTAKGACMITVHVYANSDRDAAERATDLFKQTMARLKADGHILAAEVSK